MQSTQTRNERDLQGTSTDGPNSHPFSVIFGYDPRTFTKADEMSSSPFDQDQQVSAELGLSFSPPPLLAISEPALSSLFGSSPSLSPLPVDDPAEVDLSSSPAAMFLSAFSPVVSEASLAPDDEGASVAGYTLGPIVGHGGFSIIRTASSAQGGTVAVKIIRRSEVDKQADPAQARKSVSREAEVWASLNHEHILPLFTVTHTPYADFFFTAYCPAGSLFDILKRDGRPALPQDDAGMMFRQVVRGLRYMHEVAGYVHGDLKPENVLVDEMGVCKIGDFGMTRKIGEIVDGVESDEEEAGEKKSNSLYRSRTISQAQLQAAHLSLGRQATGKLPYHLSLMRHHGAHARHRTSSPYPASCTQAALPNRGFAPGSLPYAAPELLLSPNNSTPHAADPAQDIWALGVMLYTLLTGRLPFSDSFEPRLQMKILHGVFEMPQGVGRSAERALRGCIERSVPNRWTIAMVDEVAWGIGWGSAADDVTPPSEDVPCTTSRSPSRSRVNEQPAERGSHRSTSRVVRSASRSTSAVRTSSRSKSRAPHHPHDRDAATPPSYHHPLLQTDAHPAHPLPTQPSFSSLTNAILRTSSVSSSDSSSSSSGPHDSAIILQPSFSLSSESTSTSDVNVTGVLPRGRMPRPRFPTVDDASVSVSVSVSRSQSPNEPATPRDRSVDLLRSRHKSPLSRPVPSLSTPDLEQHTVEGLELDALEEDARWARARSPHSESDGLAVRSLSRDCDGYGGNRDEDHSWERERSRARGRAFSRSRDELRKVMRNGSMPPALSPTRPSAWTHTHTHMSSGVKGGGTGAVTPATPIPIPGAAQATRSRSLGF